MVPYFEAGEHMDLQNVQNNGPIRYNKECRQYGPNNHGPFSAHSLYFGILVHSFVVSILGYWSILL